MLLTELSVNIPEIRQDKDSEKARSTRTQNFLTEADRESRRKPDHEGQHIPC